MSSLIQNLIHDKNKTIYRICQSVKFYVVETGLISNIALTAQLFVVSEIVSNGIGKFYFLAKKVEALFNAVLIILADYNDQRPS